MTALGGTSDWNLHSVEGIVGPTNGRNGQQSFRAAKSSETALEHETKDRLLAQPGEYGTGLSQWLKVSWVHQGRQRRTVRGGSQQSPLWSRHQRVQRTAHRPKGGRRVLDVHLDGPPYCSTPCMGADHLIDPAHFHGHCARRPLCKLFRLDQNAAARHAETVPVMQHLGAGLETIGNNLPG